MALCQALHELQIVLALILGACLTSCQPVTRARLAAALTGLTTSGAGYLARWVSQFSASSAISRQP